MQGIPECCHGPCLLPVASYHRRPRFGTTRAESVGRRGVNWGSTSGTDPICDRMCPWYTVRRVGRLTLTCERSRSSRHASQDPSYPRTEDGRVVSVGQEDPIPMGERPVSVKRGMGQSFHTLGGRETGGSSTGSSLSGSTESHMVESPRSPRTLCVSGNKRGFTLGLKFVSVDKRQDLCPQCRPPTRESCLLRRRTPGNVFLDCPVTPPFGAPGPFFGRGPVKRARPKQSHFDEHLFCVPLLFSLTFD